MVKFFCPESLRNEVDRPQCRVRGGGDDALEATSLCVVPMYTQTLHDCASHRVVVLQSTIDFDTFTIRQKRRPDMSSLAFIMCCSIFVFRQVSLADPPVTIPAGDPGTGGAVEVSSARGDALPVK